MPPISMHMQRNGQTPSNMDAQKCRKQHAKKVKGACTHDVVKGETCTIASV